MEIVTGEELISVKALKIYKHYKRKILNSEDIQKVNREPLSLLFYNSRIDAKDNENKNKEKFLLISANY